MSEHELEAGDAGYSQYQSMIDSHGISKFKDMVKQSIPIPKEGIMKQPYKIAFTGHRPNKIGGYNNAHPLRIAVKQAIEDALKRAITKFGDTHEITVITGGALGVDQDAARVAHSLGLPFIVASPFVGQEGNWPKSSKDTYSKMLSYAKEVVVVSEGGYDPAKMQIRNQWMVDNCDALVAVWDGTSGGTANCVRYALSVGKAIVRIDVTNIKDLLKGDK